MKAIKVVSSGPTKPPFSMRKGSGALEPCAQRSHQVLGTGGLFDDQRRFLQVHLLHDLGEGRVAPQGAAATGAGFERVFLEVTDLFRRERLTLMLGVAGLATDGAPGAVEQQRLGLDDIGGGRLG
jgi:hypothetical protein